MNMLQYFPKILCPMAVAWQPTYNHDIASFFFFYQLHSDSSNNNLEYKLEGWLQAIISNFIRYWIYPSTPIRSSWNVWLLQLQNVREPLDQQLQEIRTLHWVPNKMLLLLPLESVQINLQGKGIPPSISRTIVKSIQLMKLAPTRSPCRMHGVCGHETLFLSHG